LADREADPRFRPGAFAVPRRRAPGVFLQVAENYRFPNLRCRIVTGSKRAGLPRKA
jgi:hypothetical protein